MPLLIHASGMIFWGQDLHSFIQTLNTNPAGKIFWLNLCAHFNEQMVKVEIARTTFSKARELFQKCNGNASPDPGSAAYAALCAVISEDNNVIEAIQNVQEIDWAAVAELNTVVSDKTLWDRYVRFAREGPNPDVVASGTAGITRTVSDEALRAKVLQECWDSNDVDLLKRFGDKVQATNLRTAAPRFWASLQRKSRPNGADNLLSALGITGYRKGQWVIELTYSKARIEELIDLETRNRYFKRPSSLCVNDRNYPRFRALTPDEIGAFAKSEIPHWHGMTVDLGKWALHKSDHLIGLPEIMCPQLPWGEDTLPTRIKLIGRVDYPTEIPSNVHYADYLGKLFNNSTIQQDKLVEQLTA